eukprot:763310-Hanusia_phi.AAC.5
MSFTTDIRRDVNKYLLSLRARKLSWREIYWKVFRFEMISLRNCRFKIWGMIATMHCKVCGNFFTASELEHCGKYHSGIYKQVDHEIAFCPQQPLFRPGQNMGMYPCCSTPAIRFDTSNFTNTRRCTKFLGPPLRGEESLKRSLQGMLCKISRDR